MIVGIVIITRDSVIVKLKIGGMPLARKKTTDFGKKVKVALALQDRTQAWLIERVAETTGKYFDDSYLHKILVGENANPVMIDAITEILNI